MKQGARGRLFLPYPNDGKPKAIKRQLVGQAKKPDQLIVRIHLPFGDLFAAKEGTKEEPAEDAGKIEMKSFDGLKAGEQELMHGAAGVAAIVPQPFVETIVESRVSGHQQDQVTARRQQLVAIGHGKLVIFYMFDHIQCKNGVECAQQRGPAGVEVRVHQVDLIDAPDQGFACKFLPEELIVFFGKVADGEGLARFHEHRREIPYTATDFQYPSFDKGMDRLEHPSIEPVKVTNGY